MENAKWLEERRKGVGGSDIAAIMGLSPWKSAYQVYQEKRGDVKDWEGNPQMDWGKRMEPAIRQWYSDQTGRSVRLPNKIMYHKNYPFLLASLDGFTDDGRVVEIKTARSGAQWGEPGTNQIPDSYTLQCQHYMLVSGFPVADVAVSIGGAPPELYEVPTDPEIHEMIIKAAGDFWQRVVDGNPPEIVSYSDAVARFGKSSMEGFIVASEENVTQYESLVKILAQKKEAEALEEELKARLIVAIGEAGDTLADVTGRVLCTYKLAKGRRTLDAKALEKEVPDVYFKYLKTGAPSRRFLIKGE